MSKSQKTTSTVQPWAGATPVLLDVADQAQELGTEGFRVDPYTGPRVAQFSPTTTAGIEALAAPSGLVDPTQAALLENLSMDTAYRDFDTLKAVAADDVKANLASTFAGGGINSGLAGDTYTRAMTEALAGIEFDAYNQARNRQMQGIQVAPSIVNMNQAEAGGMLTAGGMLDTLAQNEINADMALYNEEQNADIEALERYANLGMGLGGIGQTQTSSTPVPLGQQIGNIASIAGGIGTALAFFSDERLKENIHADGDKHTYNYLWSPVRFRGDLSKDVPARVVGQVDGFDVVELL